MLTLNHPDGVRATGILMPAGNDGLDEEKKPAESVVVDAALAAASGPVDWPKLLIGNGWSFDALTKEHHKWAFSSLLDGLHRIATTPGEWTGWAAHYHAELIAALAAIGVPYVPLTDVSSVNPLLDGVALIASERIRQHRKWSAEHDDDHTAGSLAIAAAQLAVSGTDAHVEGVNADFWQLLKKNKGDRIKQLAIAGALIAAEIDRELRFAAREEAVAAAAAAPPEAIELLGLGHMRFPFTGEPWSGFNAAEKCLKKNGYVIGSMERDNPIGILKASPDDFVISKWSGMSNTDRRDLDGDMRPENGGGFRDSGVIVRIYNKAKLGWDEKAGEWVEF